MKVGNATRCGVRIRLVTSRVHIPDALLVKVRPLSATAFLLGPLLQKALARRASRMDRRNRARKAQQSGRAVAFGAALILIATPAGTRSMQRFLVIAALSTENHLADDPSSAFGSGSRLR